MKILFVGFGWPPKKGGGAITYTYDLTKALAKNGLKIAYFYNGEVSPRPFTYLKKVKKNNVKLYKLMNSPNSYLNFSDSQKDIANKKIETIFSAVLNDFKPDIIHIQNLAGLTTEIINIAHQQKIKILLSLHNYWFICPRVDLITNKKIICQNFTGNNCATCVPEIKISKLKAYLQQIMEWLFQLANLLPASLQKILLYIQHSYQLLSPPKKSSEIVNIPKKQNREQLFQKRQEKIKEILNTKVDHCFAVSPSVKNIYMRFGIKPEKISVLTLGTQVAENIHLPAKKPQNKINFGFMGSFNPRKGINIAIEAFLKAQHNQNADLWIYGGTRKQYEQMYGKINTEFSNITFCGKYQHQDLKQILQKIDVGIIPSICLETIPLTIFEFFCGKIPILGSNIGGMSNFIENNKNGLHFKVGDVQDLANKIDQIIISPQIIHAWQKNIPKIKSIDEHVQEIL